LPPRLVRRAAAGVAVLLALLLVLAGTAWWAARTYGRALTRERIEAALAGALDRPVRVERVALEPWRGRLALDRLAIAAGPTWDAGTMATIGRAEVRVGIASLWRRELVIGRVLVRDVDLSVTGAGEGGPFAWPGALPDRVTLGPVTAVLGDLVVERARVAYRPPAAGPRVLVEDLAARARIAGGGLDASLTAARATVTASGSTEIVETAMLRGRLAGQDLSVAEARGRWQGMPVIVRGRISGLAGSPALALDGEAQVALAGLAGRLGLAVALDGTARVRLAVGGPATAPVVTGTIEGRGLQVGPVRARTAKAGLRWHAGALAVRDVDAQALGGRVRGSADVWPADLPRTRVSARLEAVSLEELQRAAGTSAGLAGTVTLEGDAQGDPRRPASAAGSVRIETAAVVLPGAAARLGAATVSGEARFADSVLDVRRAEVRWPHLAATITGRAAVDRAHALALTATAHAEPLARAWQWTGIAGTVTANADVRGPWTAPSITGTAQAPWLAVQGIRVDDVAVPFDLAGRTLHLRDARARLGETVARVSGQLDWAAPRLDAARVREELKISLDVRAPEARAEDLAPWLPPAWPASGRFSAVARVAGTPAAWRVEGEVASARLVVRQPLEDVRARFTADPTRVSVTAASLRVAGIPVAGGGEWAWSGDARAEARLGPASLGAIPGMPDAVPVAGNASGRAVFQRRGGRQTAALEVDGRDVVVGGIGLGPGTLRATLDGETLRADVAFAERKLAATARGRAAAGASLDVDVRVSDLDPGPLVQRFAPGLGPIQGRLSATAELAVPVADPAAARGAVILDPVELTLLGERWRSAAPVLLRRAPGTVHVDRLRLASTAGEVSASGAVRDDGRLDLTASGRFPLGVLAALRPEILESGGTLQAVARVGGTTAAPELAGEGTIEDGRVTLRDYPDTVRAITARLLASPSGVRVVEATATIGGGQLRASGDVALGNGGVRGFRLDLGARRVVVAPTEGLTSTWDADLELVGAPARAQVRGEARLLRGLYTSDLSLLRLLLERRPAAGAPSAGAAALHLDLRIRLDDQLAVRSALARLRVGGTLSVQGTAAAPVVFGTAAARDGQILFRKHTFTVTSAAARFTDPRRLDPILDVQATTTIREHEILMSVTGRGDDLQIRLTSRPPLPEEDVLSLVAFGVPRAQLGPGAVLGELAGFLVQDLVGLETRGAALDVMEVETSDTGDRTVKVGKQLTPRLLAVYSQGIEQTEAQKLRVEYQLFGPLRVAGEQDFRGGFGADVLLRMRFR
jgi:autotransporter translocation and assembly factor TamB